MRQEDRIAHLEQENAALRAELAAAYARLKRLEKRLAKDSHNSSQPPSHDGVARKCRRQRKASEKRSGGQVGHIGRTLLPAAMPDEVVSHRPVMCQHCQQALEGSRGKSRNSGRCMTCRPCTWWCESIKWNRCVAPPVTTSARGRFQQVWKLQSSMDRTCARWGCTCTSIS